MPLEAIFQLHGGGLFYWWRNPEYRLKATGLPPRKYHIKL